MEKHTRGIYGGAVSSEKNNNNKKKKTEKPTTASLTMGYTNSIPGIQVTEVSSYRTNIAEKTLPNLPVCSQLDH